LLESEAIRRDEARQPRGSIQTRSALPFEYRIRRVERQGWRL